MARPHAVILGAGAAGVSAARTLTQREDLRVTLVTQTGETPFTRMLVKNVALGATSPDLIRLPLPDAELLADTAVGVDVDRREVRLASGETLTFDSLIVATGSTPRRLTVPGAAEAEQAGRLHTLYSLSDALDIRASLQRLQRPARVTVYGGGVNGSETASTLHADGYDVTLVARSAVPGVAAFGGPVAGRIAAEHSSRLKTFFGSSISTISLDRHDTVIELDHGAQVRADLLLVALGSIPSAPDPWTGGVDVDDRLRTSHPGVYGAGGAATHHDDHLGEWRIDHWDDATAQGAHAARALLHDHGLLDDPGAYRPRSGFIAMIHGRVVAGVGHTAVQQTRVVDEDPLLAVHEQAWTAVAASGIDAVGAVYQWAPRLHVVS